MRIKIILAAGILLSSGHQSEAAEASKDLDKKEYHVLYDDGCEHETTACQKRDSLAKKLTKDQRFKADKTYIGTIQTQFSEKNEASIDAYDHYFSDKKACDKARIEMNKKCSEM